MTIVVAGILKHGDDILLCQRRADQPHAHKWEFPGGKLESGESPGAALERELYEELGIRAEIGDEITRYEFAYPSKKPILLIFLRVTTWRGKIENKIFETLRWEPPANLRAYDILEGDIPLLDSGVLSL